MPLYVHFAKLVQYIEMQPVFICVNFPGETDSPQGWGYFSEVSLLYANHSQCQSFLLHHQTYRSQVYTLLFQFKRDIVSVRGGFFVIFFTFTGCDLKKKKRLKQSSFDKEIWGIAFVDVECWWWLYGQHSQHKVGQFALLWMQRNCRQVRASKCKL